MFAASAASTDAGAPAAAAIVEEGHVGELQCHDAGTSTECTAASARSHAGEPAAAEGAMERVVGADAPPREIALPAPRARMAGRHIEIGPTTARLGRPGAVRPPVDRRSELVPEESDTAPRTQLVRGRRKMARFDFFQDPVVGWLVVVNGPGLGAFRPIFEGNNTLGRARTQRIAIDFGDDAISAEEQAYIRYDSSDRSFLLVPNLAKTNIVALNDRKPTAAVPLQAMDLITVGRTQLVFVPFCGAEFDWADLGETKD